MVSGGNRESWCPTCGITTPDGEDCDFCKEFWVEASMSTTHQHHIDSALEVATNILIGALVSLAAQALIFPAYGIHVSAGTHVGIVVAFTVVSVVRQYALRRLFNGKSPYRWMKEKWL